MKFEFSWIEFWIHPTTQHTIGPIFSTYYLSIYFVLMRTPGFLALAFEKHAPSTYTTSHSQRTGMWMWVWHVTICKQNREQTRSKTHVRQTTFNWYLFEFQQFEPISTESFVSSKYLNETESCKYAEQILLFKGRSSRLIFRSSNNLPPLICGAWWNMNRNYLVLTIGELSLVIKHETGH